MPRDAPTTTTTFRLTAADRRTLKRLEEELACTKADIVRLGLAALRRDPELRHRLRAERFAAAFLSRLKDELGTHAQLRVRMDEHGNVVTEWMATRRRGPAAETEVEVNVREQGDLHFVDLIDPRTGVGIRNAYWSEARDFCFPISAVNFRRTAPLDEPEARRLPDGRTAITVTQDDGTIAHYVLGPDGQSHLLHDDQQAEWFRESEVSA
jgi:hypothetical protein